MEDEPISPKPVEDRSLEIANLSAGLRSNQLSDEQHLRVTTLMQKYKKIIDKLREENPGQFPSTGNPHP